MSMKGKLAKVIERDGWGCKLCGREIAREYGRGPLHPTLDHIIPKSKGGVDALWNLQLAHKDCNEKKGNEVPPGPRGKRLLRKCRRHRRRFPSVFEDGRLLSEPWSPWSQPIGEVEGATD